MGRLRNLAISIFVVLWTLVFHYESTRLFYLSPLAGRELPKLKFLFPPAGWIMFYNVDETFSHTEVYGLKGEGMTLIDPHDIFETRWVGYDNIRRNVLLSVLDRSSAPQFCTYLRRKFPQYENFAVAHAIWPSVTGRLRSMSSIAPLGAASPPPARGMKPRAGTATGPPGLPGEPSAVVKDKGRKLYQLAYPC